MCHEVELSSQAEVDSPSGSVEVVELSNLINKHSGWIPTLRVLVSESDLEQSGIGPGWGSIGSTAIWPSGPARPSSGFVETIRRDVSPCCGLVV